MPRLRRSLGFAAAAVSAVGCWGTPGFSLLVVNECDESVQVAFAQARSEAEAEDRLRDLDLSEPIEPGDTIRIQGGTTPPDGLVSSGFVLLVSSTAPGGVVSAVEDFTIEEDTGSLTVDTECR